VPRPVNGTPLPRTHVVCPRGPPARSPTLGRLAWLKSRWREENFLKYASENYGIDKICDYLAGIEANTKITGKSLTGRFI
jgi:hypothetical protein